MKKMCDSKDTDEKECGCCQREDAPCEYCIRNPENPDKEDPGLEDCYYHDYYNKGNDCDCCENQYLCGRDGDALGCLCFDENRECEFIERPES